MVPNAVGLKAILERNRLQQKHVAEALDVSRMTVWQWVHRRAVPAGDNMVRLLAYLRKFEPGLQAADLVAEIPADTLVDPIPTPSAETR
jgi:transcriptional regulator with XRE-family HTH domain